MDPRRRLSRPATTAAASLCLSSCMLARETAPEPAAYVEEPTPQVRAEPEVPISIEPAGGRPYLEVVAPAPTEIAAAAPAASSGPPAVVGRRAISAANREARAASRSDSFVGGVQVFAYAPGRVFEVWTAPLRVTTLSLAPGETLVAKAAGDTVRWQIAETTSGTAGADRRTHVLVKPLERGLETNLVLATDRRVYHLELRSGDADGFNAAVAWDAPAVESPTLARSTDGPEEARAEPGLDAGYRIETSGARPRWTPRSVFNDGVRTYIVFDPDLIFGEAPALFVVGADGRPQMVNYRQTGAAFVVDRLFDRAELRLGARRPTIVRIARIGETGR